MANVSLVLESSLKLIPENSRSSFFWIILTISVIALVGNSLAIVSIVKRKQKCLQKVCVISLALSDIFSVTVFATNYLDMLSRDLKTWKLGEFLCHFIPMGQVLGTTASSFALLVIALDRYQNVSVTIISQRWNPSIWKCAGLSIICFLLCTVMSYPMYIFFTQYPIQVVYPKNDEIVFEDAYLCAAIPKDRLKLYYIIMAFFIFLPTIIIFIFFYYQIAAIIWKHRKPIVSKYQNFKQGQSKFIIKRTKTVQVQRKLRTFKVIIVLMVAFTACRLPYWIYFIVKLVETIKGSTMWYFSLALTALNMLNCALNPFLYAFLNQSINGIRKCQDCFYKAALYCCCFTGKDFEEFNNKNPFVIDCDPKKVNAVGNNNSSIKFVDVVCLNKNDGVPRDK